jgi:carbon-monoxide dehydrogenase catalytic subunit
VLQRHGVPPCGTFLQQELAIITGACDAMVVDIQCIFQNVANVAKCFHTKLITTHPIAKMEQSNVIHIEFDEHHAREDAERIVKMAVDNFQNRSTDVMIPPQKGGPDRRLRRGIHPIPPGRHVPRHYYTLNDNIINGRIRGIAGVVGCNNARTRHNEGHIAGGQGTGEKRRDRSHHGLQRHRLRHGGVADPGNGRGFLRPGLAEVCETVGIPPVLHLGSCVDNSRILLAAAEVVKAGRAGQGHQRFAGGGKRAGMDE